MDSNPGTGATWIIFSHLYGLWLSEKTEKMATGEDNRTKTVQLLSQSTSVAW